MAKVNVHDRRSLERAYPPEAFASDAAENGRTESGSRNGVRILCAPDAAGDFIFEPARQQIGEAGTHAFLAPHRREDRIVDAGRDSPATQSARPDPQEGYAEFLAEIIAAAQRFGFRPEDSPSINEPRLQGLRQ
jgi:hypothetical protein